MATTEEIKTDINDQYQQQLALEMFKMRIRRDAKKYLEEEEIAGAVQTMDHKPIRVYDPLPNDTPELIPGILPESGMLGIIGEVETGKSTCALEIASSLLTGEPLWGAIQPNRTIRKVTYILGEHTAVTLQGLYHRLQLPHKGDFQIIGPDLLHPYKALVIGGIAQQAAIDRMLQWTEGANLVVFDPLAAFGQGEKVENDNAAMRTLMDTLSLIAQKQKAACLVLHHMGKASMGQDGREYRRESYASRGATAIEDSLTHCFYLRRKTLIAGKDGIERYELSVRKFKGLTTHDTFVLERDGTTKRNHLVNEAIKRSGRDSASREEKARFWQQVMNLQERKPKLDWDTCIEMVAAAHGLAIATVKRWEGGSED